MNTSADNTPLAKSIAFNDDSFSVALKDGRTLSIPYTWYPRLIAATVSQRNRYELSGEGEGIHWPELDEDVSVAGLIAGRHDQTNFARRYWEEHPQHRPNILTEV
ncbi:MAG: DUF2442 domain-containing protein [Rhizobacter sp.]|nr:DUF2442 domain-containing protein [Chlorobiales bacterium]